jgi:hypothetical protein
LKRKELDRVREKRNYFCVHGGRAGTRLENLGITVSQVIKEGGGGNGNDLDLLFTGRKTMSGVPIKSSMNAD